MDIKYGSSLRKWYSHLFNDPEKSAIIAKQLGLGVGGQDTTLKAVGETKGCLHIIQENTLAVLISEVEELKRKNLNKWAGDDKYRIWEVNDPNMPKEVR